MDEETNKNIADTSQNAPQEPVLTQNKREIPWVPIIIFAIVVIIAVAGYFIYSNSEVVLDQPSVGTLAPTDICELYVSTPNPPSLSSSQRLECEKVWSIPVYAPEINGYYSRFSYYPTKLTLSGTYIKFLFDENDEANFFTTKAIHFLPNKNEFSKLPISDYLPDDKQVNFRNVDAEISFGVQNETHSSKSGKFCTLSGSATIEISEITIDNFEGGIPSSARLHANLDKIIEKGPYSIECN